MSFTNSLIISLYSWPESVVTTALFGPALLTSVPFLTSLTTCLIPSALGLGLIGLDLHLHLHLLILLLLFLDRLPLHFFLILRAQPLDS